MSATWEEARADCLQTRDSDLVIIENAVENRFIYETAQAAGGEDWWIGEYISRTLKVFQKLLAYIIMNADEHSCKPKTLMLNCPFLCQCASISGSNDSKRIILVLAIQRLLVQIRPGPLLFF